MEFTLALKGVEKLMADNAMFAKRLPPVVLNAMRRPLRRTITRIKKRIRTECGIGVSIWGAKGSGLDKLVTLIPARVSDSRVETGVKLSGIPAMIERGGRFKAHRIRRGFGRKTSIPHPGSAVRAHHIAQDEMGRIYSPVMMAVREDISKLIAKTYGGGGLAAAA